MATFHPLPEAARRLGVSQSALRRRLRAGVAQGERRPSAGGFTWWVRVDEPAPTPEDSPGQPTPTLGLGAELVAAQEAVRRLEAHVGSLTEELAARRREVGQLHTLLAQAQQRGLMAPGSPGGASTNGVAHDQALAGPASPSETPSAPRAGGPAGRSWWQRLWAG